MTRSRFTQSDLAGRSSHSTDGTGKSCFDSFSAPTAFCIPWEFQENNKQTGSSNYQSCSPFFSHKRYDIGTGVRIWGHQLLHFLSPSTEPPTEESDGVLIHIREWHRRGRSRGFWGWPYGRLYLVPFFTNFFFSSRTNASIQKWTIGIEG